MSFRYPFEYLQSQPLPPPPPVPPQTQQYPQGYPPPPQTHQYQQGYAPPSQTQQYQQGYPPPPQARRVAEIIRYPSLVLVSENGSTHRVHFAVGTNDEYHCFQLENIQRVIDISKWEYAPFSDPYIEDLIAELAIPPARRFWFRNILERLQQYVRHHGNFSSYQSGGYSHQSRAQYAHVPARAPAPPTAAVQPLPPPPHVQVPMPTAEVQPLPPPPQVPSPTAAVPRLLAQPPTVAAVTAQQRVPQEPTPLASESDVEPQSSTPESTPEPTPQKKKLRNHKNRNKEKRTKHSSSKKRARSKSATTTATPQKKKRKIEIDSATVAVIKKKLIAHIDSLSSSGSLSKFTKREFKAWVENQDYVDEWSTICGQLFRDGDGVMRNKRWRCEKVRQGFSLRPVEDDDDNGSGKEDGDGEIGAGARKDKTEMDADVDADLPDPNAHNKNNNAPTDANDALIESPTDANDAEHAHQEDDAEHTNPNETEHKHQDDDAEQLQTNESIST